MAKVKIHKKPKKPKLGTGRRFKALVVKLKGKKKKKSRRNRKKKVSDPKALAAWIGRKKYGKKKFQKLSEIGRMRARRKKQGLD